MLIVVLSGIKLVAGTTSASLRKAFFNGIWTGMVDVHVRALDNMFDL